MNIFFPYKYGKFKVFFVELTLRFVHFMRHRRRHQLSWSCAIFVQIQTPNGFLWELITSLDVIQFCVRFFFILSVSVSVFASADRTHSTRKTLYASSVKRRMEKSSLLTEKWMWKYFSLPLGDGDDDGEWDWSVYVCLLSPCFRYA